MRIDYELQEWAVFINATFYDGQLPNVTIIRASFESDVVQIMKSGDFKLNKKEIKNMKKLLGLHVGIEQEQAFIFMNDDDLTPGDKMDTGVFLHEMAHHVQMIEAPNSKDHGRKFRKIAKFLGEKAGFTKEEIRKYIYL